jgi:hypothetical protein
MFKSLFPRYFFVLNPTRHVSVEHVSRDCWGDVVSIDTADYAFSFDEDMEIDEGYILDYSNLFEIIFLT